MKKRLIIALFLTLVIAIGSLSILAVNYLKTPVETIDPAFQTLIEGVNHKNLTTENWYVQEEYENYTEVYASKAGISENILYFRWVLDVIWGMDANLTVEIEGNWKNITSNQPRLGIGEYFTLFVIWGKILNISSSINQVSFQVHVYGPIENTFPCERYVERYDPPTYEPRAISGFPFEFFPTTVIIGALAIKSKSKVRKSFQH